MVIFKTIMGHYDHVGVASKHQEMPCPMASRKQQISFGRSQLKAFSTKKNTFDRTEITNEWISEQAGKILPRNSQNGITENGTFSRNPNRSHPTIISNYLIYSYIIWIYHLLTPQLTLSNNSLHSVQFNHVNIIVYGASIFMKCNVCV